MEKLQAVLPTWAQRHRTIDVLNWKQNSYHTRGILVPIAVFKDACVVKEYHNDMIAEAFAHRGAA
jgi:hypothetical protein